MQLTLMTSCHSLGNTSSSGLESQTMGSPSSSCSLYEVGPPTPSGKCAGLQLPRDNSVCSDAETTQHPSDRRGAYRRLQLEVPPCGDSMQQQQVDSCSSGASSARRVLPTTGSYTSVCCWLEQQVSKRVGPIGDGLIAARSHSPVSLIPVLEAPLTPARMDEEPGAASLPAPAFQLLGLL